jgi:hypothetical protein
MSSTHININSNSREKLSSTIFGGFFGAIYSIILIGPVAATFDRYIYDNYIDLVFKCLCLVVLLVLTYLVIRKSIDWIEIDYSSRLTDYLFGSLFVSKGCQVAGFAFELILLIGLSAYAMYVFCTLNCGKTLMWTIGVSTTLFLQVKAYEGD